MQVYIGIDWSEEKHDIVFLNHEPKAIARLTVPHSGNGLAKLEQTRQKLALEPSACVVGLETSHNLVIDFLWSHNYEQVYVIPPSMVDSTRGRYRQSGARTDQSDAFVIADLLRTDRHRFQPWQPGSQLLQQMRAKASLIQFLTRQSVAITNRLRAVLLRYYPAALQVFTKWPSFIVLEFIRAYPTPQAAAQLSFAEFRAFAKQHGYPKPRLLLGCYDRLQADYPRCQEAVVSAYQTEAVQLAEMLLSTMRTKQATLEQLQALFHQHPDQVIFGSLPGAARWLAPALLVKFGEDRNRFPTANHVQALAGTCPVTKASGKQRSIRFRRSCDREFRNVAQQWARSSLSTSVWANAYWQEVRQRVGSDNHAYRCLANRWLAIAWKLWQTHQPYDEAFHLQQRAIRRRPKL